MAMANAPGNDLFSHAANALATSPPRRLASAISCKPRTNGTTMDRLHLSVPGVCVGIACLLALLAFSPSRLHAEEPVAERITFMSADSQTTLVGYLFNPATLSAVRLPAVVMLHGRGGALSARANGVYYV